MLLIWTCFACAGMIFQVPSPPCMSCNTHSWLCIVGSLQYHLTLPSCAQGPVKQAVLVLRRHAH